jgi:signal peptidase II
MTDDAPTTSPSDEAPKADASPSPAEAPPAAIAAPAAAPPPYTPNFVFLGVVGALTLALDLGSKSWAKARLDDKPFPERRIDVIGDHLALMFAKNRGGAWGLLQDEPESIRRPFFLAISVVAIVFIVSLYRKLAPRQWALRWGLPLVLGGALGNLVNRIQFNYVVDFIDYRADWVKTLNGMLSQHPSDHWPTFNVADVAIVAGVVLMAIDMFTPAAKPVVTPALASAPTPEPAAPPLAAAEGNPDVAPDAVPVVPPAPPAPAPTPKET